LRVSGDAFSLLWPSFPLPWHCLNQSRGRSPVHCEMFYSSPTHCRRLQRQPDEATGDKGQRHCEYSLHLYPTGAVAAWSFPDVGPFGVALSHRYLALTSHTSALLRPHHVQLALLMPQRFAPPARSPSPFPARIASPHIGIDCPAYLKHRDRLHNPRSLPLFLSSILASRTNCFRCFFLYFGLFHLPSTCPGGAFSFNLACPIHPNASQQVSFIGLS
jgi:hypothetical protein